MKLEITSLCTSEQGQCFNTYLPNLLEADIHTFALKSLSINTPLVLCLPHFESGFYLEQSGASK